MKSKKNYNENPNIVVMNINPENIDNCIKYTIHGAKIDTPAASKVNRLNKGDICLIRRTSGGGRYRYGVAGIWYFHDKEDIEGETEQLWVPATGWKYKIYMKPLIKKFKELFNEDFSIDIEGQLRHKGSSKVEGLQQVDIQGAVKLGIDNQELHKKYLEAIIDEKKDELCEFNMK